ncbi:MaoC/PaaZ C-terminal domain-containing protein [Rarobacter incanus]
MTSINVGDVVATRTIAVDRKTLVRYAGASGDFNDIHYSDVVARAVGLPGVIAHGMWTMGAAVSVLEDFLGDAGLVIDYQTRFSRPVEVPSTGTAEINVSVAVGAIDAARGTVRFDLSVTVSGARVLTKAQAVARLG